MTQLRPTKYRNFAVTRKDLYNIEIDEVSNLGTARIRVRSLKAAVKERDDNDFIPHKIDDYTINRVKFTEEERKKHTIIFPQMSPTHFGLFEAVMRANG